MKKVLYNATVIPVNTGMDIIEKGYIRIENGIIKEVAEGDVEIKGNVEGVDMGGMWIMPGFINTHTHVPMVLLRGYADDLPLHNWLNDYIFPVEARYMTPENIRIAARFAMIEMIKSGTTCFNDMYFFEDMIAAEVKRIGMRVVLSDSLIDFPTVSFKSVDEGLERIEQLLKTYRNDENIHPSVCVHSPYTCSENTLKRAKNLSDKYNVPLHIHLAETREEVRMVREKTGKLPVEYLKSIGVLDNRAIAAHCVWFDDEETERFVATGAAIAHCPKSNLKLGSGIAGITTYMQAGITVGLGTDGAASNNVLDMIEEMRFAALLPKGVHLNPEVADARTILRMATINGAKALGLEDTTGSLEIGKRADLICIKPGIHMYPFYDKYSALVYTLKSEDVDSSMVNGEWIMRNRKILKTNENELTEELLAKNEEIKNNFSVKNSIKK